MKLSPEDIEEFKAIYRKEYGVELSDAEAAYQARSLLQLVGAVDRAVARKRESSSGSIHATNRTSCSRNDGDLASDR